MAFGVTPEGFVRKDLDTIKSEIEAELRAAGDDRLRFVKDGDVLTF